MESLPRSEDRYVFHCGEVYSLADTLALDGLEVGDKGRGLALRHLEACQSAFHNSADRAEVEHACDG